MSITPNEAQQEAVNALSGPVLISAGAGSGKTRTLTERFVHALSDHPEERWVAASADEILAITFTDKAARELAERVRTTLVEQGREDALAAMDRSWISTIHGFCSRVLRLHALEAGVDPYFGVADAVTAGELSGFALETAMGNAVERGADDILALYGVDALRQVIVQAAEYARVHGFDGGALRAEPAPELHRVLEEAIAAYRGAASQLESCDPTRADVDALRAGCRCVLEVLDSIPAVDLPVEEAALSAWRVMTQHRPAGRSKDAKSVLEGLRPAYEHAVSSLATIATSHWAGQVCELVSEYSRAYQALKREKAILDFTDLQVETVRLLEGRADVLESIRSRFRLVMVDEFQDTDVLQLRIINAVSGEQLCTVGDEQQSIYGFRGADIEVYRRHNETMRSRGAREIVLSRNYRSHVAVLSFVNHQFEQMFAGRAIALAAGREEGPPVLPVGTPRVQAVFVRSPGRDEEEGDSRRREAHEIATRFARLRDEEGIAARDMVILLRAYTHAAAYSKALEAQGFAASIIGGNRFFEEPEIHTARALLRVIANPLDDEAFAMLLGGGPFAQGADTLWKIRMRNPYKPLWERVRDHIEADGDSPALERLFGSLQAAHERVQWASISSTLVRLIRDSGWAAQLASAGATGRAAQANIDKLCRMADSFEMRQAAGVRGFIADLDARVRHGEYTQPAVVVDGTADSAVRIMSIHASKGLEFPVVALPELGSSGANDTMIANWRCSEDSMWLSMRIPAAQVQGSRSESAYSSWFAENRETHREFALDEARRLFYVGCTRARELLILSGSDGFTKSPEESSQLPIHWVRRAWGLGEISAGEVAVRTMGEATLHAEMIDASGWRPPGPIEMQQIKPGLADISSAVPSEAPCVSAKEPSTSRDNLRRLSYSDLAAFRACGLRFKAVVIDRLGVVAEPMERVATDIGSALHAVLEAARGTDGADRVDAICSSFGLSEAQYREVADAARAFSDSRTAARLRACGSVAYEWPFFMHVDDDAMTMTLNGSIDVLAVADQGALVVDYKSGTSGALPEVRVRYELQADVYALAALHAGHDDVEVIFTRPQVLDDLGSPQEIVFRYARSDEEAVKERLLAIYRQIVRGDYRPREEWEPRLCGSCPLAEGACSVAPPKGWRYSMARLSR